MKIFSHLLVLFTLATLALSCKKEGFPVPPASTVPLFSYTVDNNSYAPALVSFTDTSIIPKTVGTVDYSWNFGDGTTSADSCPKHNYTSPGVYNVTLTIKTNISQEIVSITKQLTILNSKVSGISVYFTDGSYVYKGYLTNEQPVFTALSIGPFDDAFGMAIDTVHLKLYLSDDGAGKIYRCNLDGDSLIEFRTGLSAPDGLAIDFINNMLYWDTDNGIQRTSLSISTVTNKEDFITGQTGDPEGVSIDQINHKLYWINYEDNGGLWSINLDGSGQTELITTASGGSTLVVNNRLFFDYYVESGNIHLKSSNLDGTGMSTIATGISRLVFALGYEPTSNKIYWGDRTAGKILRANLDGTGIETWYTKAGSSPRGLVFGKKK
jgi:hypothetical protein